MIRVIAINVNTNETIVDDQFEHVEVAVDVGYDENVTPNGKRRMQLRSWTGAESFDGFEAP